VIAESGNPAGQANKFFNKLFIPKSAAQSPQAEIGPQTIFSTVLPCIQGGIDKQNGINPLEFFTKKFVWDFQKALASMVSREIQHSLS